MKRIIAALSMSAAALPAFAAPDLPPVQAAAVPDSGLYVGVNLGASSASGPSGYSLTKSTGGVFGLLGAYQFNRYFAGEAQYGYLGKAEYNNNAGNIKTHTFGMNAVGTLPLSDVFAVYGKLGLAFNLSRVSGMTGITDRTRFMPIVGLGVQYHVTPHIGFRFGWERYDAAVENAAGKAQNYHKDAWTFGGLYRF